MSDLEKLSKKELMELVVKLKNKGKNVKLGRKEELGRLLVLSGKKWSIKELSKEMGIKRKNVSSVKRYLVEDGWIIGKDGRDKLIVEEVGEEWLWLLDEEDGKEGDENV
jgi:DNA-binding MarR family transcriptional regulator